MINLSIIIPIYNAENYLMDCLNSIKNQINQNIEVILINDGSTDKSLEILDIFFKTLTPEEINNFTLINKKNSGVSHTRNKGIKISKGDYITFIDSDDFISPEYIKKIFHAIYKNPDLIQINAYCIFENSPSKNYILNTHNLNGLHTLNNELKGLIFNENSWFSWIRIFKRELFNNILFPEKISHFEDAYIIAEIINNSKYIYMISDCLYNYRIINSSATRTKDFKTKEKLLLSSEKIIEKLIILYSKNIIFGIPLIHFFNIYINETKKYKQDLKKENWGKFSARIDNLKIPPKIIKNNNERFLVYFLKFGLFGHYLAKKLSKFIK
ncbi:glycosyltransferase family 2 protein [Acinetobacter equi]|uniref:Glycosyltransferase 2-like domain-containing protein n=1 Tax=Acinetobacter equi TaxID=1324350 RepID=A0A0N7GXN5_9GAMM|nr:glycosyltransferase [Acinetobacter equi]ALH95211.1 hypothetical protein AOY20_06480 [Acinetobacter equi]